MMTKNEQIASLLLEAAELLKDGGVLTEGSKYRENYTTSNLSSKETGKMSAGALHRARNYAKWIDNETDPARRADLIRCYENEWDLVSDAGKASRHITASGKRDLAKSLAKSNKLTDRQKEIHHNINKRASLKEAIDLLYDKAIEAETMDEAADYINKAEELEAMIESM